MICKAPPLYGETILRVAVEKIEAQPDRWNQNSFLGTSPYGVTMCLAGWIAHLSGVNVPETMRKDPTGRVLVGHVRALLGLGDRGAQLLFWDFGVGTNTHPTVEKLKERITEITGVTFDEPAEQQMRAAGVEPDQIRRARELYDTTDAVTGDPLGVRLRESLRTHGGFRLGHDTGCEAVFVPDSSSWSACRCAERARAGEAAESSAARDVSGV